MYEPDYCSLLLLLCERKFATFSKHNIRYEYDVFSRSRQVLILLYLRNIAVGTYSATTLFTLYPAVVSAAQARRVVVCSMCSPLILVVAY